jgi:hypothetical protein
MQLGMTDTDFKKRSALKSVWPSIKLLICRFHLLQAWRKHLNKELVAGKAKSAADGMRNNTRTFLRQLERM